MKNILFTIVVFMPVFLNNELGRYLGIEQMLTITMSPLLIFSLFHIRKFNTVKYNTNKNIAISVIILFYVASSALLLKISAAQYEYIRDIIYMAFVPGCIILAFENLTPTQYKILRLIVIAFFIFQSVTVIAEWITMKNFFYIESNYDSPVNLDINDIMNIENSINIGRWAFRAQGVFVHPILSSMIASIMILCILFSTIKNNIKFILLFIGLVAILTINTRTGIVLTAIMLIPALFHNYKSMANKYRKITLLVVVFSVGLLIYLIFNTDLGGRLLNQKVLDESSEQRLITLSFLDVLSNEWLLHGRMDYTDLMLASYIGWIENGYIAFILKYGLIVGIPLLLSLIWVHICQLRRIPRIGGICIFLTYYAYAVTNPHLANQSIWLYFLFSYYAFFPPGNLKEKR